ncbi:hypothetical protein GCM10010228_70880 [Streptomyces massasporeus]|nr:hypothetical protein GCM10010228_70880 [Streptomyces massasporeus]
MAIDVLPMCGSAWFPAITGRPDQRKRSVMQWPMKERAEGVKLPLRLAGRAAAGVKTRDETPWHDSAHGTSAADPRLERGHPV